MCANITQFKSHACNGPRFLAQNRYELNLSNEALNIHFAQGDAKIREVKAGVKEKSVVF